MRALAALINSQRGRLFYWVPVLLAVGIGAYFQIRFEPDPVALASVGGLGAILLGLGLRRVSLAPLAMAAGLVGCGFALAGARAHYVAGPVLEHRYYGSVSGRVVAIDRSASDKLRITLDRVVLERRGPKDTPLRVRLSLHGGGAGMTRFVPGQVIMTTAHLSPPQGPVEPGGFDFQRHAWFKRLGAVGYTRVPVLLVDPPERGPGLAVHRARMAMSEWVQNALSGVSGRFAAALMTGDRSGMDAATLTDLRRTNLAHLLAISGLHMGLLTGFVFALVRLVLATVPRIALRWPIKKIAAVAALLAGAVYLALSGASVATERAFVMVAVMLVAVLVDRRAISLRGIALAAIVVLILRPESLLSPGFQMSFAATTALVAAFTTLRELTLPRLATPVRWAGTLVMSSAVAGMATAPFAAAHFNIFSSYGLVANLASVPLMGSVVMPGAVLAVLLAPVGLEQIGFALVGFGLDWILWVAGHIAAWEGAVRHIAQPPAAVLPLISVGALFVILWAGWARWIGAFPVLAALVVWTNVSRPDVLIAEQGGLVGVMNSEGRALSRPRGDGFAARVWLENDGDGVVQLVAFERSGQDAARTDARLSLDAMTILHLRGKAARDAGPEACDKVDVVVAAARIPDADRWPCLVVDQARLRNSGAMSGQMQNGKLVLTSVRQVRGRRLWSPPETPLSRDQ